MFTLNFNGKFLRKEKKLTKNNPRFKKAVSKAIELLADNPDNPILKSHKVKDKSGNPAFSSRVTGDIRIIWNYNKNEINVIDVLDIGGHEGKDKVYK